VERPAGTPLDAGHVDAFALDAVDIALLEILTHHTHEPHGRVQRRRQREVARGAAEDAPAALERRLHIVVRERSDDENAVAHGARP
jgi:hypothetical protein